MKSASFSSSSKKGCLPGQYILQLDSSSNWRKELEMGGGGEVHDFNEEGMMAELEVSGP